MLPWTPWRGRRTRIADPVWRCQFCERPATAWIWLIRWQLRDGRRDAASQQDMRTFVCSACLTQMGRDHRLFLRDGWAYGASAAPAG